MKNQLIQASQAAENGNYELIKKFRTQLNTKQALSQAFKTLFSSQIPLAALFHGLTAIIDTLLTSLFARSFCIDFAANFEGFYKQTLNAAKTLQFSNNNYSKAIFNEFARLVSILAVSGTDRDFYTQLLFYNDIFTSKITAEMIDLIYQKTDFISMENDLFLAFSHTVQNYNDMSPKILQKLVQGTNYNGRSLPAKQILEGLIILIEKTDFLQQLFDDYTNTAELLFSISNILIQQNKTKQQCVFIQKLHCLTVEFLNYQELQNEMRVKISSVSLLLSQINSYGPDLINCQVENQFYQILIKFNVRLLNQSISEDNFNEFCVYLQKHFLRIKSFLNMYNNNIQSNVELEYLLNNSKIAAQILNEIFTKPAILQIVNGNVIEFWHIIIQVSLYSDDFILDVFLDQFVNMIESESDYIINLKFIINICYLDLFLEKPDSLVLLIKNIFNNLNTYINQIEVVNLVIEAITRIVTDPETLELAEFNLPQNYIDQLLQIHEVLLNEAEAQNLLKWNDVQDDYIDYEVENINIFRSIQQINNLLLSCIDCNSQIHLSLLSEKALLYTPVESISKIITYLDINQIIPNNVLLSVILRQHGQYADNQLALPINEFYLQNILFQIQFSFQHDLAPLYFKIFDHLISAKNIEFLLNSLLEITPKFIFNNEKSLIESFSMKFSSQNLEILSNKLQHLFSILTPQQQQTYLTDLYKIIHLILDSSTNTNNFDDDMLYDNQSVKSTLICQEILFPFLEENFFFDSLTQLIEQKNFTLALDLLTFTLQIPPRAVHLKLCTSFLSNLIQNCFSAPLRGKDCISERELGIVLSKADNPLEIVFQGYEKFCYSSELEIDREGMENQIMSKIEINEFERCCGVIYGDIMREVIEEVKKFVFK